MIAKISGKPMKYTYIDQNRIGDHICYYSDLKKMKDHYPNWDITKSLEDVFVDIYTRYMAMLWMPPNPDHIKIQQITKVDQVEPEGVIGLWKGVSKDDIDTVQL